MVTISTAFSVVDGELHIMGTLHLNNEENGMEFVKTSVVGDG